MFDAANETRTIEDLGRQGIRGDRQHVVGSIKQRGHLAAGLGDGFAHLPGDVLGDGLAVVAEVAHGGADARDAFVEGYA